MRCDECGTKNVAEAKFCIECGAMLVLLCRSCGAANPLGSASCVECGEVLLRPSAPTDAPAKLTEQQALRLARYIPRHLVTRILSERGGIIGERKQGTFLFADVVGSTRLGEELGEEEFRAIMDGALRAMIEQVHRYGGTVGQLRGDEVFALFGIPAAHEDDAERAVRTALGIQQSMAEYGKTLSEQWGLPPFQVRVTLNTGDVVAGDIGSDLHAEYTAMGDAVNTAAKMQGVAKAGSVLASEATYHLVRGRFYADPLGPMSLKGKQRPVRLYEIRGEKPTTEKPWELAELTSPLVGREQEIAGLRRCFARLRSGEGHVVSVVGEAGIGKSRLVAELLSELPSDRIARIEAHCLSVGASHSYHPFISAIRGVFGIMDDDPVPAAQVKLKHAIKDTFESEEQRSDAETYLSVVLGLTDPSRKGEASDPEAVRRGINRAVCRLIERMADRKPVVICIEDAQWIDRPSAELLRLLVESTEHASVLVLCVHRPEREAEVRKVMQAAKKDLAEHFAEFALSPLSESESEALVANLLSAPRTTALLSRPILERAEGNPLFVEEILRSMIDKGVIVRETDGWTIVDAGSDVAVPRLLRGIIAERIDRLSDVPRRVLLASAVVGRSVPFDVLAMMVDDLDPARIEEAVSELVQASLLYEAQEIPHREYTFKHELTREAAYSTLLGDARAMLHRRAGIALEVFFEGQIASNAALLAHHFRLAEAWEPALRYLLVAAKRAQATYSNQEALTQLSEAIELTSRLEEPDQSRLRFDLLRRRTAIHAHLGATDEEASDLEQLREVSSLLDDEPSTAEVSLLASDFANRIGRLEEALTEAEEGQKIFERSEDEEGQARALVAAAAALERMGELETAFDRFGMALERFRKTEDKRGEAAALKGLGTILARRGMLDESAERYECALALYRELEDAKGESDILGNLGSISLLRDDYEEAIARFEEAEAAFRKVENVRGEAKCLNNLGTCHSHLGDYERACRLHQRALELYTQIGDEASKGNALGNLGIAQAAMAAGGNPAFATRPMPHDQLLLTAVANHQRALEIYEAVGDRVGVVTARFNKGRALLAAGDTDAALACLRGALSLAEELQLETWAIRALAALGVTRLRRGESPDALERSREAVERLEEIAIPDSDEIHFARYQVLLSCGEKAEAKRHLDLAARSAKGKAARIRDGATRKRFLSGLSELLDSGELHRG